MVIPSLQATRQNQHIKRQKAVELVLQDIEQQMLHLAWQQSRPYDTLL